MLQQQLESNIRGERRLVRKFGPWKNGRMCINKHEWMRKRVIKSADREQMTMSTAYSGPRKLAFENTR